MSNGQPISVLFADALPDHVFESWLSTARGFRSSRAEVVEANEVLASKHAL